MARSNRGLGREEYWEVGVEEAKIQSHYHYWEENVIVSRCLEGLADELGLASLSAGLPPHPHPSCDFI